MIDSLLNEGQSFTFEQLSKMSKSKILELFLHVISSLESVYSVRVFKETEGYESRAERIRRMLKYSIT